MKIITPSPDRVITNRESNWMEDQTDILIINGPNLNLLGMREPHIYGRQTLADIHTASKSLCAELGLSLNWMQSNYEGELVGIIQKAAGIGDSVQTRAIIINAAAYTHTSVAIRDSLALFEGIKIEIHVSNTQKREDFRHHSYLSAVCDGIIAGLGIDSYLLAIRAVASRLAA